MRAVVNNVLKAGGEMNFRRRGGWKFVESLVGKGRSPMLNRSTHPVRAGLLRQVFKGFEVKVDFRNRSVRQRDTAVTGAGLNADFTDPG